MKPLKTSVVLILVLCAGIAFLLAQNARLDELRRMDANNDGMITRAEWRGAAGAFSRLDITQPDIALRDPDSFYGMSLRAVRIKTHV